MGPDLLSPAPLVLPGGVAVGVTKEFEIRKLSLLFSEVFSLAEEGALQAQFRDAVPRFELMNRAGLVADVRIDENGTDFVWRPTFGRRPVSDIPGAAQALVELLDV